jgi:hypothetical protein
MEKLIKERFVKVDGFLKLELTQQNKIVNAFLDGYWNHYLETWECKTSANGILRDFFSTNTRIRGKEDVLELHRYSDFDLRIWFRRILGEQIEEDGYISFSNGGYMKRIIKK